jgi:hypothetical protein
MFHLAGKLIFQDFSKYETKLICCYINLLYSTNGAKCIGKKMEWVEKGGAVS